jgi:hypothetical protein
MASRDPLADRYELWPIWRSHQHNQFYKLLLGLVDVFWFSEVLKLAIAQTQRLLNTIQRYHTYISPICLGLRFMPASHVDGRRMRRWHSQLDDVQHALAELS